MAASAVRRGLILAIAALLLGTPVALILYRTWPQKLVLQRTDCLPQPLFRDGHWAVVYPAPALVAEVGTYKDKYLAYLEFDHLRTRRAVKQADVLMTAGSKEGVPVYKLRLVVENNLLAAVPYLAGLKAQGYIHGYVLGPVNQAQLAAWKRQTQLELALYDRPLHARLSHFSDTQLVPPLARFLWFMSRTDRRVRERIDPVPAVLSREQACILAGDIVLVSRFYGLPLGDFLGIGAMENNYMSVKGDLDHAAWKKRAQRDDIVLKRRHGRVLVQDFSTGVWQITRQTLRFAHDLYLQDHRDYSVLPESLRPAEKLDLNLPNPRVLTTYAGLLFRYLLDRFEGDVPMAVGAYNGGVYDPNLAYANGVRMVARSARKFLVHAATLKALPQAG